MKEFKINKYISLKLENGKTNIYLNDRLFKQCKYLLLSRRINEIENILLTDSVDELEKELDHTLENQKGEKFKVPPETEFWGHCSNLQVWYENNYDSRLLHSNLAFPLLRKLYEVEDPLARKIFKEEIAKRLDSGFPSVVNYLIEMNYIDFLSTEELISCVLDINEIDILYELKSLMNVYFKLVTEFDINQRASFTVKRKHITGIYLNDQNVKIPSSIKNLSYLKRLYLEYNKNIDFCDISQENTLLIEELVIIGSLLMNFPEFISKLNSLKFLRFEGNKLITLPKSIGGLSNLEELYLGRNNLKYLPNSINQLKSLKSLQLNSNQLTMLPQSIGNLSNLEELSLRNNKLTEIPESIGNLKSLKKLVLNDNDLVELPKSIGGLSNLEELYLANNKLSYLPDSIGRLKSLKILWLNNNQLKKLPDSINNLTYLKELYLKNNDLKETPKPLENLNFSNFF